MAPKRVKSVRFDQCLFIHFPWRAGRQFIRCAIVLLIILIVVVVVSNVIWNPNIGMSIFSVLAATTSQSEPFPSEFQMSD